MNRHSGRGDFRDIYTITCENRNRFVIYNASAIGNPTDHQADKWYYRVYPVPVGMEAGEPFETAAEAERAARDSIGVSVGRQ